MVNVFSLSETTRLANAHLYLATCLSQQSMSMVARAVHICISTAFFVVPMKLLMRNSCLRLRKNTSMSHLALYSDAMVEAARVKLWPIGHFAG